MTTRTQLEAYFSGLCSTRFAITSPEDPDYNCIAWAASDATRWWWPGGRGGGSYWPPGLPSSCELDNFQKAFELAGYVVCADDRPERGHEKVAIYVNAAGTPTHAARQVPNGWTSKLGRQEDIEHEKLSGVAGHGQHEYGEVALTMSRRIPARAESGLTAGRLRMTWSNGLDKIVRRWRGPRSTTTLAMPNIATGFRDRWSHDQTVSAALSAEDRKSNHQVASR